MGHGAGKIGHTQRGAYVQTLDGNRLHQHERALPLPCSIQPNSSASAHRTWVVLAASWQGSICRWEIGAMRLADSEAGLLGSIYAPPTSAKCQRKTAASVTVRSKPAPTTRAPGDSHRSRQPNASPGPPFLSHPLPTNCPPDRCPSAQLCAPGGLASAIPWSSRTLRADRRSEGVL